MLRVDRLARYRDVFVVVIQTIAVLIFALVITIVSCGFNFKEFNWLTFAFNFIFTTSMKASYTNYAKIKEMQEENIVLLMNTITLDRKAIFDAQKTKEFEEEVEHRNKINKLEAYINELDRKNYRNPKKNKEKIEIRTWAFEYKNALIEKKDTLEYEKTRSINSIKVDYEKIKTSKLFTYGASNKNRHKKYVFSAFSSSLNRALVPTTVSLILAVIFGTIQNDSSLNTGQVWIELAGYLFSIALGIWWGLNNGKSIIREDYAEVLNNIVSLIRDIKTKIGIK